MSETNSKFDLSFLNKISGGDEVFILEMITTFKEMTPEFIENAQLYLKESDFDALGKEAHKFVPGVSFLGIKELEVNLQYIEEYCKKLINLDQVPDLLEKSIQQTNDIVTTFNEHFNLE